MEALAEKYHEIPQLVPISALLAESIRADDLSSSTAESDAILGHCWKWSNPKQCTHFDRNSNPVHPVSDRTPLLDRVLPALGMGAPLGILAGRVECPNRQYRSARGRVPNCATLHQLIDQGHPYDSRLSTLRGGGTDHCRLSVPLRSIRSEAETNQANAITFPDALVEIISIPEWYPADFDSWSFWLKIPRWHSRE